VPPIVTPVKSPTHVRSASLPVTNGFANRFTHVKQPSITSEVTMKSLPELPAKIMDATTNIVDEVSQ
jgi:hypothetical protein